MITFMSFMYRLNQQVAYLLTPYYSTPQLLTTQLPNKSYLPRFHHQHHALCEAVGLFRFVFLVEAGSEYR